MRAEGYGFGTYWEISVPWLYRKLTLKRPPKVS